MIKIIIGIINNISRGRISVQGHNEQIAKYQNINEIVLNHFEFIKNKNHPCKETFMHALLTFEKNFSGSDNILIVETGSSAWGVNSSILLDSVSNYMKCNFETVDIRINPLLRLYKIVSNRTILHVDDSIKFLKKSAVKNKKIGFLYLDSCDVDWKYPEKSAVHGLNEFIEALPCLQSGSVVLIDDTPIDLNELSYVSRDAAIDYESSKKERLGIGGKGALVKNYVEVNKIGKTIFHKYQLLIEIF